MPRADLVPVVAAQDQEVLEALQIDWRALDVARGARGRPPHAGAALEPMPFINRPAVTTAPLLHVREPWTPPEAPLRFRDMLLDGRRVKHMTDYLDRLHTSLLRGSRLRKPFVLREEELKQQYRGRPWDISNLNAVVPLDDSDEAPPPPPDICTADTRAGYQIFLPWYAASTLAPTLSGARFILLAAFFTSDGRRRRSDAGFK